MRRVTIIADDYGLSSGIGKGIRALIERGRITGTGCMTLFPEWREESMSLKVAIAGVDAEIGLHATLTDFAPLSGRSPLGEQDKLPGARRLIMASRLGSLDEDRLHDELDMQLQAFVDEMGRMPDFIDGHQHVHFLPQVRRWFEARRKTLERRGKLPWLRGAPSIRLAPDWRIAPKVGIVVLMAAGFDRQMKQVGFPVRGPLVGFYDWNRPAMFSKVLQQIDAGFPEGAVVMCHPGMIDDTLIGRDGLVAARAVEFAMLGGDRPQARQEPFTSA